MGYAERLWNLWDGQSSADGSGHQDLVRRSEEMGLEIDAFIRDLRAEVERLGAVEHDLCLVLDEARDLVQRVYDAFSDSSYIGVEKNASLSACDVAIRGWSFDPEDQENNPPNTERLA